MDDNITHIFQEPIIQISLFTNTERENARRSSPVDLLFIIITSFIIFWRAKGFYHRDGSAFQL